MPSLQTQLEKLKKASYQLQLSSTSQRNKALKNIKTTLLNNIPSILRANKKDLAKMDDANPLRDRLLLTEERIHSICREIDTIIKLPDPLNRVLEEYTPPSKIHLKKVSVPLGCVGVIYESRPNVTIDVTALCLKSGNTILLRGGSDAYESNKILTKLIHEALEKSDIPKESVQLLKPDRELVTAMMKANQYLDLIIPRGSMSLIQIVREQSTVPTIETGASVVHTFVDESADLDMACTIVHNEKTRRPSVCNAVDTVLVHQKIAATFLKKLAQKMSRSDTILHCDKKAYELLKTHYPKENLTADADQQYDREFLSLQMNIHLVKSIDEAIAHIRQYSLKHSESIVTKNKKNADQFLHEVDAACVYVNTSTAFSDGAQFGLGAEIGISTQKLHARGPMGLRELTSYKWLVSSKGNIRT
ncbi:MAG: glutamate-5-semialdehyde dehydrogenase [Candidatus Altimarinota bacterium]